MLLSKDVLKLKVGLKMYPQIHIPAAADVHAHIIEEETIFLNAVFLLSPSVQLYTSVTVSTCCTSNIHFFGMFKILREQQHAGLQF